MKVLNLRCGHRHEFEGWFASLDDFASQRERRLVACPLCGDLDIERTPSAARLNLGAAAPAERSSERSMDRPLEVAQPMPGDLQAAWLHAVQHVMAHTEDVGARFSEEARRIHYGEAQERGIRGQTSREEALALREEGIEVLSLPVPAALKGTVQ